MKSKKSLKKEMLSAMLISITVIITFVLFCTVVLYRDAEKQNLELAQSSMKNVEFSVQTYFSDVNTAYQSMGYSQPVFTFLTEESTSEKWEASQSVKDLASFAQKYNSNIKDIMLVGNDLEYISFLDYTNLYEMDILKIAGSVGKDREEKSDIRLYRSDSAQYLLFFYPIYDVFSSRNFREKIGTMVFVCYADSLQQLVQLNQESEAICINLLDSFGKTAFSSLDEGGDAGNVLLSESTVSYTDWKIQGYYQPLLMAESSWKVLFILIGLLLLILLTTVLLSYRIHHRILVPIGSITLQMKEVAENRSKRITCTAENEIGDIALHINEMLTEISKKNEQIVQAERQLHESELLKNQAELKALQSQINPHFLYNTLQCIRGLAIQHHVPDIPVITTAMADIFRYSIRSDKMVPLREEIHALQSYLSIIQVRYQGKIQSQITVSPDLLEVPVLKMILQPIVENAIHHGIETSTGEKRIDVQVEKVQEVILISIVNSGTAIEPEKLKMLKESLRSQTPITQSSRTSIGLSNINNRLKLQYGSAFGLDIESPVDFITKTGTRVQMCFPFTSSEERT